MSIIIMILLLSLLILVHEAGHFFAARAFGIKVDKFGFGLPVGPTLYKTKVGDVEVLVNAFLLLADTFLFLMTRKIVNFQKTLRKDLQINRHGRERLLFLPA